LEPGRGGGGDSARVTNSSGAGAGGASRRGEGGEGGVQTVGGGKGVGDPRGRRLLHAVGAERHCMQQLVAAVGRCRLNQVDR
jgi:hypothetical protein